MRKQKRKKKHLGFKIFVVIQLLLMVLVLGVVAFYYLGGYGDQVSAMRKNARELVSASSRSTFRAVETSLVYDANGEQISALKGEKDVYYLEYQEIPEYVIGAIISIEDKKFYKHPGYDFKAIFRAVLAFIQNGEAKQGGSTITQQLARNVFLTQERTWQRKVQEIFVAVELEQHYSKDDILEFYLNNIYFANGYYGIQAASMGYFNTEVKNLSLSQIALLCGIPNNPTIYDPVTNMENALERRDRILDQMREDGKISDTTCREAKMEEIVLDRPEKTKWDYVETYTYYCAARILMEEQGFVFQQEFDSVAAEEAYLEEYDELYRSCREDLYQKGYRIYTSMDLTIQEQLQSVVDSALSEYTEVNEEGIYTLQSAAVCIDNKSGMVKAIVGGRDQNLSGYTLNRGYQSFRQPGSAIKPLIVYTPALERGYTPDSLVWDMELEDGPQNADGRFDGEMTLRQAVAWSKNSVAWQLFQEISPEAGLSYLKQMKFARIQPDDYRLTSALGGFTTGVSPLEMAAGYEAIVNEGNYREPTCISRITDSQGNEIYVHQEENIPVYQQNAARMTTDMLQGVLTEGTGQGLALSSMPSAGKTGTTNDNKDGWFVGYTRYYTTSVWVGYDMPKELPGLTGSSYPGVIWNRFMESIHQGLTPQSFLPYIRIVEPESEEEEVLEEGSVLGGEDLSGEDVEPVEEDASP